MPQTPVEKPHILLSHEMLMPLQPMLEGAYEVHRLWDYPDRIAFLEGPGRRVRAIVPRGRVRPLARHALGNAAAGSDRLRQRARHRRHPLDGAERRRCRRPRGGTGSGRLARHRRGRSAPARRPLDPCGAHGPAPRPARPQGGHRRPGPHRRGRRQPSERLRDEGVLVGAAPQGQRLSSRRELDGPGARQRRAGDLLALRRLEPSFDRQGGDRSRRASRPDRQCRARRADRRGRPDRGPEGRNPGHGGSGRLCAGADAAARWVGVPHTVLTPHSAGATLDSLPAMVSLTLENLRRYFHGEPLASPWRLNARAEA
ncbi:hypothetical protein Lal_00006911 [Lupinus albus]|nr:hypothetical protein Lal_00006911 [Lupinus albus]